MKYFWRLALELELGDVVREEEGKLAEVQVGSISKRLRDE